MFKNLKARLAMWAVAACAAVALIPPTAAADDYGSQQQPVQTYSVDCGHLGDGCDRPSQPSSKPKARKACGHKANRRRSSVRAYAALPRNSRHSSRRACGSRKR